MSDRENVERASQQCRDVIREAHEATKDLKAALAEQRQFLRTAVDERVRAEVAVQVERQVKLLGNATQAAMAAAVAKVGSEFDKLAEIFLGTADGGPTMEELVKRHRSTARASRPGGLL